MTRTFHCALVGGPFDGDSGWVRDDTGDDGPPETIWAGHCRPLHLCEEVHWTLDPVDAANRGYERYGYEKTIDDLHIYVAADVMTGQDIRAVEEIPVYG